MRCDAVKKAAGEAGKMNIMSHGCLTQSNAVIESIDRQGV